MNLADFGDGLLDRMERAVQKVRDLLLRTTARLEEAGIPYAIIGGNAVAAWVSTVDESGVRNTPDVDILLRRADFAAARDALAAVGIALAPEQWPRIRDAVHAVFAGETVRAQDILPAPDLTETAPGPGYRFVTLGALVRMKLTAFRLIDRVHLRDMLGVAVIDPSWLARLPPDLAARLKELIDTPDG